MKLPKRLLIFLTDSAVALCFLAGCQALPEDPPPTVQSVDLSRYTGLWYELARLPVFFQKGNELALAEYEINDEGTIDLVNTALAPDDSKRSVTGTAVPVAGSNNTKLKVSIDNFFAKLFGSPPYYGNYWILKLESDYGIALVGSPNRKTLWLLAKTPEISQEKLDNYINYAKELGFDTNNLIVNNGKF
jgi:apolipoprotein D and lipocalin family protein